MFQIPTGLNKFTPMTAAWTGSRYLLLSRGNWGVKHKPDPATILSLRTKIEDLTAADSKVVWGRCSYKRDKFQPRKRCLPAPCISTLIAPPEAYEPRGRVPSQCRCCQSAEMLVTRGINSSVGVHMDNLLGEEAAQNVHFQDWPGATAWLTAPFRWHLQLSYH